MIKFLEYLALPLILLLGRDRQTAQVAHAETIATTNAQAYAPGHGKHEQTNTNGWAIAGTILFSIAVILLLILLLKPKSKPETKWVWTVYETHTVLLSKKYGDSYTCPYPDTYNGSGFDCINATKPYTAINMAGYEVSCNAGDNIGKYFPSSDPNNTVIRLKLRDSTDQIGEVTYISKKMIRIPK